jgi:DNA-binding NarL/FixJ family response regulator
VREGLKAILAAQLDFAVVGEAGPADDLPRLVDRAQPDVVLLNPGLPMMSGQDVCAQIIRNHPEIRILIVSTYSEIDLVKACIVAGAHGYVIRDIDGVELMQAVREVHRGDVTVSSATASRLIDQMRRLVRVRTEPTHWNPVISLFADRVHDDPSSRGPAAALAQLTSRERDVLARLLEGERVPAIAAGLFVSQSTVRNHLSAIFRKFGVHSQTELMRRLWST